MDSVLEREIRPDQREILFCNYGTYLVTDKIAYPLTDSKDKQLEDPRSVLLVSQPNWESTLNVLENRSFGKTTVLTPELITIAGWPFEQIEQRRLEIENSLKKVSNISSAQPDVTFIIGTPNFVDESSLPFNAAVVFKNGKIEEVARKKLLVSDEQDYFDLEPEDSPTVVGDSALLVCRDLIGAQKTRLANPLNNVASYVQRATGDKNLSDKFTNSQFIKDGTSRILVSSCWGTGMPAGSVLSRANTPQEVIDDFYRKNLESMGQSLLRNDPTLNQIIVCDRAPLMKEGRIVASKPMSAVFFKH